jgi:hypothetical protein
MGAIVGSDSMNGCCTSPDLFHRELSGYESKLLVQVNVEAFVMLNGLAVCNVISLVRVSEVACHCRYHSFFQIFGTLGLPSMIERNSFE